MDIEIKSKRSKDKWDKIVPWIYIVVLVLVFLGVRVQKAEVESCWEELRVYRLQESYPQGLDDYQLPNVTFNYDGEKYSTRPSAEEVS